MPRMKAVKVLTTPSSYQPDTMTDAEMLQVAVESTVPLGEKSLWEYLAFVVPISVMRPAEMQLVPRKTQRCDP
ncbi:hypothetical protein NESM_000587500 [Novymonas esmeraldas]|uniref:Uncharacterized protein n=1 Tax=Novymonas esmeraldas TaxID=1808958 RepID=A0AAW0ES04_9TRYP